MSLPDNTDFVQARGEALGGAALMTAPLWQIVLRDVSLIASAITAVCGAILGLHAIYRLWRRERARRRETLRHDPPDA